MLNAENISSSTETLVDYVARAKFDDLSEEVVSKAKEILLDTLGCGLGGSKTKPGKIVIGTVKSLGGAPESTIIGDGNKVNCVLAGFVNSILTNILDYEGTLISHPSSIVIPAAIAVGERVEASGKDLINAIVVGHEVSVRITKAVQPSKLRAEEVAVIFSSWSFGAAAAACKLLNLDKNTIIDAFGYAGSNTPVPTWISKWGRPLPWSKNNWGGQTTAGILGAILAEKGFIAPHNILDSRLGFWRMIGSDRCDFDAMVEKLGKEYKIMNTSFKPYPACGWLHPTLDAVKLILHEHKLRPESIKQIKAKTLSIVAEWFMDYEPREIVDAEFSLPYTIAMIVLGEEPGPSWYADAKLRDPKVLSIAKKVKATSNSELDDLYHKFREKVSEVEVVTKDNRYFKKRVERPKGDPRNPITKDELLNKFRNLASSAMLRDKKINQIIERVNKIEELKCISGLTSLLKY